jgi:hypothetical protein
MQQQLSQQQEQAAAISPPGMNTDHYIKWILKS